MSFKECLSSVTQESGHDTFRGVFDIAGTAEGTERLIELIEKFPVLTGMRDALAEQARLDAAVGVGSAEIDNICLGFGLALGTLALIAESEIPHSG